MAKQTIDIDLSKLKTSTFILSTISTNVVTVYACLYEATDGKVADMPVSELPALFAQYMKAIDELSTDISLAIGSMSKYLKEKNEE